MGKPIDGAKVRALRRQKGLTLDALAEKANMAKDSLSRLELGKQTGTWKKTLAGLSAALEVSPDVLTGETAAPPQIVGSSPPAVEKPATENGSSQMNVRISNAARNAFSLAALRYRIPVARIVEIAPLLFVFAAEQSLRWRSGRIFVIQEALAETEKALDKAPYVSNALWHMNEVIKAELAAIERKNILYVTPEMRDDVDNPFVEDLNKIFRGNIDEDPGPELNLEDIGFGEDVDFGLDSEHREGSKMGERPEREPKQRNPKLVDGADEFSRDVCRFRVCCDDATKFAAGDEYLASAIIQGRVLLHEMPRELLTGTAVERRLAWLREKDAAHHEASASEPSLESDSNRVLNDGKHMI